MKINKTNTLLISIIFISLFFCCCSNSSKLHDISLEGDWKFFKGDLNSFKDKEINESEWDTVQVPKSLEQQGYKEFKGVGWYRKKRRGCPQDCLGGHEASRAPERRTSAKDLLKGFPAGSRYAPEACGSAWQQKGQIFQWGIW